LSIHAKDVEASGVHARCERLAVQTLPQDESRAYEKTENKDCPRFISYFISCLKRITFNESDKVARRLTWRGHLHH